jgi:hypothetical protein
MGNLSNELVESFGAGMLLESLRGTTAKWQTTPEDIADELARLHNAGRIDLVAAFSQLRNRDGQNLNFFTTRRIFEQALPKIDAPVANVITCVNTLFGQAGSDGMAGTILSAFIEYCANDSLRPEKALAIIDRQPELIGLLPSALIAGSRNDFDDFLKKTLNYSRSEVPPARSQAVFAIGRLAWKSDVSVSEPVYARLEELADNESDDAILANTVNSAYSLVANADTDQARLTAVIDKALGKGGDVSIHTASSIFGFETKGIPTELLDVLVPHLLSVKAENNRTIDNIDFGIDHLFKSGETAKALEVIEGLLLRNPGMLSMAAFDSVRGTILTKQELLHRVVTRWLLNGAPVFCTAIHDMIQGVGGQPVRLEVSGDEFDPPTSAKCIFVAKKAIGYLFFSPVSAASLLISLMARAPDKGTLGALSQLLFDPLLMNYTGEALEYVRQRSSDVPKKIKAALTEAIDSVESYLKELRAIEILPELHPSVAHREAYYRVQSRLMAESYKEAEKQSVFLSIMHKTILLYGRKSVTYVWGPDGSHRRIETPMQSHSVQFETPRGEQLDPFGTDYLLRMFRMERWRQ